MLLLKSHIISKIKFYRTRINRISRVKNQSEKIKNLDDSLSLLTRNNDTWFNPSIPYQIIHPFP